MNKAYKRFITERDQALEKLLNNNRRRVTDQLNICFTALVELHAAKAAHGTIQMVIDSTARNIQDLVKDLRRKVDFLTVKSETFILSQIRGKPPGHPARKEDLEAPLAAGGSVFQRAQYYLEWISKKMELKARRLRMMDEPVTKQDLARVVPKRKRIPRARPVLKRLKEAGALAPIKQYAVMTDQEWANILDDYQTEYVPKNRGPEDFFGDEEVQDATGIPTAMMDDTVYQWQLEQDITHDFVERVRDGQVDAANANGYTDFVWIAILDDRTDECCIWRDGLKTSEIELALAGDHADDECDASVPPAHFNCRCTLAPVTDDLPEASQNDILGDFTDWLNEQG